MALSANHVGATYRQMWRHLVAYNGTSLYCLLLCVLSVVDLRRVIGLSQVYITKLWFVHRHTLATPFTSKKKRN